MSLSALYTVSNMELRSHPLLLLAVAQGAGVFVTTGAVAASNAG